MAGRRTFGLLAFCLILVFAADTVPAASNYDQAFYVAPGGDDGNPGTLELWQKRGHRQGKLTQQLPG